MNFISKLKDKYRWTNLSRFGRATLKCLKLRKVLQKLKFLLCDMAVRKNYVQFCLLGI